LNARTERLYAGLRNRDRAAVAEALNLVDDRRPAERADALELLDAVHADAHSQAQVQAQAQARAESERGWRIGVTGPPGAGKSTLLNVIVREVRRRDLEVGVVAVDPSSRRSGGALLGDRMRLDTAARESGVFLRSMAARERLGGLADATFASVEILTAVFDRVFVETVGIGQSESEISRLVDTLVFVVQPGAGDTLQFMKAGILEWPDVFVVNKADVGAAAERTRSELVAGLGLGERRDDAWTPPVLSCSARDDAGLDAVFDAIEAHREAQQSSGAAAQRRAEARSAFVLGALLRRYGSAGIERLGGEAAVVARAESNAAPSPFRLADEMGDEIIAAWRADEGGSGS